MSRRRGTSTSLVLEPPRPFIPSSSSPRILPYRRSRSAPCYRRRSSRDSAGNYRGYLPTSWREFPAARSDFGPQGHRTAYARFLVLCGVIGRPKGSVNESWHELVAERLCLRCNQVTALKRKRLLTPPR